MREEKQEALNDSPSDRWQFSDLIDFEYFLHCAADPESSPSDQQDRGIYLENISPFDKGPWGSAVARRRFLFMRWLRARRARIDPGELLPGTLVANAYPWIRNLLGLGGLLIGASAAAVCLDYDGKHPVNVAAYFGVLVMPQIALAILAVGLLAFRWRTRSEARVSLWQNVLLPLMARVAHWGHRQWIARRPREEQNRVRHFFAYWSGRRSLFDSVFYWRVLSLIQMVGVAFNIGVLAATLALVVFSDRAFGWQSAVQFDSESVHAFVETVAVPWKWIVPDRIGVPSLEDIKETRIILKDGISALTTERLVSWWPFLCFGVGVYGLAPRIGMLFGSLAASRWSLNRIQFDYVECDRLFDRMITSSLETIALAEETSAGRAVGGDRWEPSATSESVDTGACVLFIPADIRERFDAASIEQGVLRRFHWTISHQFEFRLGMQSDLRSIEEMQALESRDGSVCVLILHEAWRPPIDEFMHFLKQVRGRLKQNAKIAIGLLGKPISQGHYSSVKDSDFRVWKQTIETVGDPHLRLEKLLSDG